MLVTKFCIRTEKNRIFQAALDLIARDLLNKSTMQYRSPSGSKAFFVVVVLVPTLTYQFSQYLLEERAEIIDFFLIFFLKLSINPLTTGLGSH